MEALDEGDDGFDFVLGTQVLEAVWHCGDLSLLDHWRTIKIFFNFLQRNLDKFRTSVGVGFEQADGVFRFSKQDPGTMRKGTFIKG